MYYNLLTKHKFAKNIFTGLCINEIT